MLHFNECLRFSYPNNLLNNWISLLISYSQKVVFNSDEEIFLYFVVLTPKSVNILLRLDAKTHIAPCISILSSPYESALEYPYTFLSSAFLASIIYRSLYFSAKKADFSLSVFFLNGGDLKHYLCSLVAL